MINLHLDWMALSIGTVGTVLWAHHGKFEKHAATFWLISSFLWVGYAYQKGLPALGTRDIISILLYFYGAFRWLKTKTN